MEKHEFDSTDPWTDVVSSCAWAIRSTVMPTVNASPAQLIFGRDMLFDLSFAVKWRDVRNKRIELRKQNNERENKGRVQHQYKVGDLVLLNRDKLQRKLNTKRDGAFEIIKVYANGTVKLQKGVVTEKLSIRRIQPYTQRHN